MNEKMVLIIGGSSGIGFEVARQARERGAQLKVVARDPAKLAIAAERLGGAVKTAVLDAHDDKALENFFVNEDDFDHLVSTIGDSMAGGFLTTTPETMRHVLHSKFWTNWMIGRRAASKLRRGGSITFTAGTGGRPYEISATYVANLGIGALVQGLACELAPPHSSKCSRADFYGKRNHVLARNAQRRPRSSKHRIQRERAAEAIRHR